MKWYIIFGVAAGAFVSVWAVVDMAEKLAEAGLGVVAQVVRLMVGL